MGDSTSERTRRMSPREGWKTFFVHTSFMLGATLILSVLVEAAMGRYPASLHDVAQTMAFGIGLYAIALIISIPLLALKKPLGWLTWISLSTLMAFTQGRGPPVADERALASDASTQASPAAPNEVHLLDPEIFINANGSSSARLGDDGKTQIYSYTERAESGRIELLSNQIEALPKNEKLLQVCDFMRGAAKAKLIEDHGVTIDVAVTNYGYSGSTIACTFKYMIGSTVGTQLLFSKQGQNGLYMVFITD